MLKKEIRDILSDSSKHGWVLEPDAKRLLSVSGIDTPRFINATRMEDAVSFAKKIGYPVVAKVVSPDIVHKSDQNGVAVGIGDNCELEKIFKRFIKAKGFAGMLVEEMLSGVELIIGAKTDFQFGPVILLGIGGTGVEIYQDVCVRMAPLEQKNIESMIKGLKGHEILSGYRGAESIDQSVLTRTLMTFSDLVMELAGVFESIDLNPVICSRERCVVADARIMLKGRRWENI